MSGAGQWQPKPPSGLRYEFPGYPEPKNITTLGPFGIGVAGKPPKEGLFSVTYPAPRPQHRNPPPAVPQPFRQSSRVYQPPPATPRIPLPGPLPNRSIPGLPTGRSSLFNPPSPPAAPIHRPLHWRPPTNLPFQNPTTQVQRLTNMQTIILSAANAVVQRNPHLVPNPHFRLGAPPPPPVNITRIP
ncbi:hypothetical protein ACQ7DA_09550 [Zafaria sp. J156]|uniref:hypothetical protein n=1 Tax=Zafaria sp. J156 TaxID=3116490 RepID=UPI002E797819|nr:hypothetical protein [Zafaria sp. J156]MEE1621929.1 hypothetical protein [Zafaria sp. J156]